MMEEDDKRESRVVEEGVFLGFAVFVALMILGAVYMLYTDEHAQEFIRAFF